MWIIVKHENEVVGRVFTNRSLVEDEILELAGIDTDETNDGELVWNRDAFEFESLSDAEADEMGLSDI